MLYAKQMSYFLALQKPQYIKVIPKITKIQNWNKTDLKDFLRHPGYRKEIIFNKDWANQQTDYVLNNTHPYLSAVLHSLENNVDIGRSVDDSFYLSWVYLHSSIIILISNVIFIFLDNLWIWS